MLAFLLVMLACWLGSLMLCIMAVELGSVGVRDVHHAQQVYVVAFKNAGDECATAELSVDLVDGQLLGCSFQEVHPPSQSADPAPPRADVAGFTVEQNDEIAALARQLGADGWTTEERVSVQDQMNQLVATIPRAQRRDYSLRHHGTVEIVEGAGLLISGACILFFTTKRWRREF